MRTFTRVANMSPGQRDTGTDIDADHINDLQEAAEDLQTGALSIALPGIAGALESYGPLRVVRSPFEFGGVGDGTTDDYAAIMSAYDALPSSGGVLELAGREWYSSQTLDFGAQKALVLEGGARGEYSSVTPLGAVLRFPLGINGVVVRGSPTGSSKSPIVRDLSIVTPSYASRPSAGDGHGLVMEASRSQISRVFVQGFRGHGIYYGSGSFVPTANTNVGRIDSCSARYNAGHGLCIEGEDSNVLLVSGGAFDVNGGYGIYNNGSYNNAFIGVHAAFNVTGDFYDDSWSSMWLTPYSEGAGKFVIGKASNSGTLFCGNLGGPAIWTEQTNGDITEGSSRTRTLGWTVYQAGELQEYMAIRGYAGVKDRWELVTESPGTNWVRFKSEDGGSIWAAHGQSASKFVVHATQLGFYGVTPIARPTALTAANAGTVNSGDATTDAVIENLRTRLNEAETKLKALGLFT